MRMLVGLREWPNARSSEGVCNREILYSLLVCKENGDESCGVAIFKGLGSFEMPFCATCM